MSTPSIPELRHLRKSASIDNLPVNLFGAVMGIAGCSMAWRLAGHEFGVGSFMSDAAGALAALVFVALAIGYLAKAARYPDAVVREYRHPIGGNFFGTIGIAMLMLSSVFAQLSRPLAEVVWTLGTVATLGLCFAMVSRLLQGRVDPAHAVPAWFLPCVATLDITVAGSDMAMPWAHEVDLFALAIGTAMALLFFNMIMARMIHREPLAAGMVPSLLILVAPFEVGFLAYTNFTRHVDDFAGLLFYFGLFVFLALAPKVFRKSIPFATGWWSISFPMAALASAALKYSMFAGAWPLALLAIVLLGLLTLAIAILLVRTVHRFVSTSDFGPRPARPPGGAGWSWGDPASADGRQVARPPSCGVDPRQA